MKFGELVDNLPPYDEYEEAWIKANLDSFILNDCTCRSRVITVFVDCLNRVHYRLRCVECWRFVGGIKKAIAIEQLAGLEPIEDCHPSETSCNRQIAIQKVQEARVAFRRDVPILLHKLKDDYRKRYMMTNAWATLRQLVFVRDGNRCQECGSVTDLECHHITYKRLGAEEMSDLVTLCNLCHHNHHSDQRMERDRRRLWHENQLLINNRLQG